MSECQCGCGLPVEGRRPDAVYATNACRTRAHRERKAADAVAAVVTATLRNSARLCPSAYRVLRALAAAGDVGATTRTLCQPQVGGVRFSARIMELRDAGLTITCVRERQGSSRYWLIADELERAA